VVGRPAARSRRTGDEVRALILASAREVFSREGYAGATTREIATRAGIAEPLIFRNFGDKVGLFRHAVFDAFEGFVHDYGRHATERFATWHGEGERDEALAREYLAGLYDHLRANRALFQALLRTRFDAEHDLDVAGPLEGLFRELAEIAESGLTAAGFQPPDVALIVRFTFGLVFSIAVLDDWLLPRGRRRPSRRRIVDELVGFVTQGVNRYPPASGTGATSSRSADGRHHTANPDRRSGDAHTNGEQAGASRGGRRGRGGGGAGVAGGGLRRR
jgi:AcrR family transcriptional regulator